MKLLLVLMYFGLNFLPAFASDHEQAKRLAITCSACHGLNGISNSPIWPNLAKQKKLYLVKQLRDFRSGERRDLVMNPMANTLSDQDMELLAEYFSEMK